MRYCKLQNKILIFLVIIFSSVSCAGKDTLYEFTDPDISILKVHDPDRDPPELYALYISSTHTTVDMDIIDYIEVNGDIYAIGEKGYTVLDVKTKKFKQSINIDDFNSDEKEILKGLSMEVR